MAEQTEQSPTSKPRSAAAWKRRREHDVTLPSGAEVTIVLPNLPALAKAGQIPNELLDVASEQVNTGQVEASTAEQITLLADFHRYLVSITVVAPKIEADDVPELPYEDINMLVEFAIRSRDQDALGHHLSGLDRTAEWRSFREERLGLAALLGASGSG